MKFRKHKIYLRLHTGKQAVCCAARKCVTKKLELAGRQMNVEMTLGVGVGWLVWSGFGLWTVDWLREVAWRGSNMIDFFVLELIGFCQNLAEN